MMQFIIPSMTCGHCVGVVTRSVRQVDAHARVDIDLATHRVLVETNASQQSIRDALVGAGYPPG